MTLFCVPGTHTLGLVVYAMGAPTGWLVQMEGLVGARLLPVRVAVEGEVGLKIKDPRNP